MSLPPFVPVLRWRALLGLLFFAAGLAGDRALSRRHAAGAGEKEAGGQGAESGPRLAGDSAGDERGEATGHRKRDGGAPRAETVLVAKLVADELWSEETMRELLERLTADPALLNALWRQARADQREPMLARIFSVIRQTCPSLLYRLLPKVDFTIPSSWGIPQLFADQISCDPERGVEALRRAAGHFQKEDLNKTLVQIAGTSPAAAHRLLEVSITEEFGNVEIFRRAADSLLRAGLTLPKGTEDLPGVSEAIGKSDQNEVDLAVARRWQEGGFSVEALDAVRQDGGRPGAGLQVLIAKGAVPPSQAFAVLVENGFKKDAGEALHTLASMQHLDHAIEIAKGLPDFKGRDELFQEFIRQSSDLMEWSHGLFELSGRIENPKYREWTMSNLLDRLATVDPQTAKSLLGQIEDEKLREKIAEKISAAEVGP